VKWFFGALLHNLLSPNKFAIPCPKQKKKKRDLSILGRKTIIKTESLKILILNLDILKFAIYNSFIFCLFAFSKATPAAYGGSQARGLIRAVATHLHHSHSNTGSEPHL